MSDQENKLAREIVQEYSVYHKHSDEFFPSYRKVEHLNGKSLAKIQDYIFKNSNPEGFGDCYDKLVKTSTKKGSLILKFALIPGRDSDAAKNQEPLSHFFYKIVPELKIVKGEQK